MLRRSIKESPVFLEQGEMCFYGDGFSEVLGKLGFQDQSLKGAVPSVVYGAGTAMWSHIYHPQEKKKKKKIFPRVWRHEWHKTRLFFMQNENSTAFPQVTLCACPLPAQAREAPQKPWISVVLHFSQTTPPGPTPGGFTPHAAHTGSSPRPSQHQQDQ